MKTTIIDDISPLAPVGKTKAPKATISGSADLSGAQPAAGPPISGRSGLWKDVLSLKRNLLKKQRKHAG